MKSEMLETIHAKLARRDLLALSGDRDRPGRLAASPRAAHPSALGFLDYLASLEARIAELEKKHHGVITGNNFDGKIHRVVLAVANAFEISPGDIYGDERFETYVKARFAAVWLAREMKLGTLISIARKLKYKSHGSESNCCRRCQEMMDTDPEYAQKIKSLLAILTYRQP